MSNTSAQLSADCETRACGGAVELLIHAQDKDLGGFTVRRVLPTVQRKMVGPWLFCDHLGPARFAAGQGINVRPHPHVNLATVTYLFDGEILHRDSTGSVQAIRPGDLNLMVAGRGIVHSERERPEVRARPHRVHGLQLWLALPEADEEIEPCFFHYPAAEIPATQLDGVSLRVIMGTAFGCSSPVKSYAETLYVEASLLAGQKLLAPEAQERAVYVASGALQIGDTEVPAHALAVLAPGQAVNICATADARIAIIGGERMGKRYMEWNFVSSRKARVEQAKVDWRAGRFAKVPGDEVEFIPLPE